MIFPQLQENFKKNGLKEISYRKSLLKRLKTEIKLHTEALENAMALDFGKPPLESYLGEISFVVDEINFILSHLSDWAKPRSVRTPLKLLPAKSWIQYQPVGPVLIISPWNYPVQLTLAPLAGAISAGCPTLIKASELTPKTNQVLRQLLSKVFSKDEVSFVELGKAESEKLLEHDWGHVFFTGGSKTGAKIAKTLGGKLISHTLELGGKNPCIVDSTANIPLAAKKILWGKAFNAGQTCVAPDLIFLEKQAEETFIHEFKKEFARSFGSSALDHKDYCQLINLQHFDRQVMLLQDCEILVGGQYNRDKLQLEPALVRIKEDQSELWQEEIFGPILPMVTFESENQLQSLLEKHAQKPLSFYVFSKNQKFIDELLEKNLSGGAAINDVMIQIGNPYLPFGGVGQSGIGRYHGIHSFLTFSHQRAVMKSPSCFDLPIRYRPYDRFLQLIRKIV